MVSKTRRKIIKIGNKKYQSEAITLPLDWIRFNQPTNVDVYYDSLIVIVLPNQSNNLAERIKDFLRLISKQEEVYI